MSVAERGARALEFYPFVKAERRQGVLSTPFVLSHNDSGVSRRQNNLRTLWIFQFSVDRT
jgi:hypothetical protein